MHVLFCLYISSFLFSPGVDKNRTQELFPYGKQYCIEAQCNGQTCWLIIDSGASISLVHEEMAPELDCPKGAERQMRLKDAGGAESKLYSFSSDCSIALNHSRLPREDWFILSGGLPFSQRDGIQPIGVVGMNCLRRLKAVIHYGNPVTLTYSLP